MQTNTQKKIISKRKALQVIKNEIQKINECENTLNNRIEKARSYPQCEQTIGVIKTLKQLLETYDSQYGVLIDIYTSIENL